MAYPSPAYEYMSPSCVPHHMDTLLYMQSHNLTQLIAEKLTLLDKPYPNPFCNFCDTSLMNQQM